MTAQDTTGATDDAHAAACWRLLITSPHVAELLGEWIEWAQRRDLSESTAAMAAALDWRAAAAAPSYAELERRRASNPTRAQTSEQIRAQAAESWARVEQWIHQRHNTAARTAAVRKEAA